MRVFPINTRAQSAQNGYARVFRVLSTVAA